jgi:hypothetical protein
LPTAMNDVDISQTPVDSTLLEGKS